MNSFHCHIAFAPNPWRSSKLGFVSFLILGAQQCMIVPSPRSVVVDLSPALEKEYRKHESKVEEKLKQAAIIRFRTTKFPRYFLDQRENPGKMVEHRRNYKFRNGEKVEILFGIGIWESVLSARKEFLVSSGEEKREISPHLGELLILETVKIGRQIEIK